MTDNEVRAAMLLSSLLLNKLSAEEYRQKRRELNAIPNVEVLTLPRDEKHGVVSPVP